MSIYLSKKLEGSRNLRNGLNFIDERKYLDLINKNRIKTIGILNLMPNKIETEAHLLNLLEDTNENLAIKFIRLKTYKAKNIDNDYLRENYYIFDDIKNELDAIIITGAPVEKLEFGNVDYIDELKEILDYSKFNLKSSICICWSAQAALNHFYGVRKVVHEEKIFGVYEHNILHKDKILKGLDDNFKSPHSRYTSLLESDIRNCQDISVLCITNECKEHIVKGKYNDYYIFGHCEYDEYTLRNEYIRDCSLDIDIQLPKNYFVDDNPSKGVILNWREASVRLYQNWIKECI